MSQVVEKCPILQRWRILREIPGSGSRCGLLTKFNQFLLVPQVYLVKFSDKIFFSCFYMKLLTDRQKENRHKERQKRGS